ncbi:GntR family transcriptional regulator [Cognatishimia maritima]|uniref:DNA-binding transcriptional regulator, GntR family n=1 Tax=Cognatishimia maritima TaxID=870908 RepID=A0A1M5QUM3_9RHOB|nr:GntR family transcriptional regulator [Cognatishimia maritima]SHH17815.1 DNA-binding transcriptional regulator, GntR family [Cognatishimia maritima]
MTNPKNAPAKSQDKPPFIGDIDRSRPIGAQIYEAVRLNIILENLKPLEPINEAELAKWFGVSRTPVRDAYLRLIEDGLISTQNKVGTMVAPMNDARVREGIIIRRALEREVVKIICTGDKDLRALDKIIALQSVAVSHGDYIEFFRLDEEFHAEMANLAELPSAWRLAHSVKAHTDRARIVLTSNLPNRINIAFQEHLAIVDALVARDEELAQALVTKHINSAIEAVKDDA